MNRYIAYAMMVVLPMGALADTRAVCSRRDAAQISDDLGRSVTWNKLFDDFNSFRPCTSGPGWLAELYSDAIARLLSDKWKDFSTFADLAERNNAFRDFVLHHIDLTADLTNIKAAAENVRHCKPNQESLCSLLSERLETVLREYDDN